MENYCKTHPCEKFPHASADVGWLRRGRRQDGLHVAEWRRRVDVKGPGAAHQLERHHSQ